MIKSNVKGKAPRREAYKKEIRLVTGAYYAPTKLKGGFVTVYPWDSAVDEWFADKVQNSKSKFVLYEAVSKVAQLNGLDWKDLTDADAETIVMVSKAISTGLKAEFVSVCEKCGHKETASVPIPDGLAKINEKNPDYSGIETITLPESGDIVTFRHAFVKDLINVSTATKDERKGLSDTELLAFATIVAVGGDGKPNEQGDIEGKPGSIQEFIEWYRAISPADEAYLIDKRIELTPRIDKTVHCKCDKCENEFDYGLNLGVDFFRRSL